MIEVTTKVEHKKMSDYMCYNTPVIHTSGNKTSTKAFAKCDKLMHKKAQSATFKILLFRKIAKAQ
jgi:hypothetical protein